MKNQYLAEWRAKNRERYNEYQKQWRREYYRRNKERVQEVNKRSRIKREKEKEHEQDTSNPSIPEREQEHNILGSNSEVQSNEVIGHNLQAKETGSEHPHGRGDKHKPRGRSDKVRKVHLQGGSIMTAKQLLKGIQQVTDPTRFKYDPDKIKIYFIDDAGKKVEAVQLRYGFQQDVKGDDQRLRVLEFIIE